MVVDRQTGRDRPAPSYCSRCGTGLEPTMNYCPTCGDPVDARRDVGDAVGTDRSRSGDRVTDRDVLEYRIAMAARDGWRLERDFGDHAIVVRRTVGDLTEHVVIAVLTFWFTMGLGNVLYGAYRYVADPQRAVLRADRVEAGGSDGDGGTDADDARGALAARTAAVGCWFVAAILAVIAAQVGTAGVALPLVALAVAFVGLGGSVLPSVRRRLERRHPASAIGRVRSVDERAVVDYDSPCISCGAPVGQGVERTYREEVCLFGLPLWGSSGHNAYCLDCANGRPPEGEPDTVPAPGACAHTGSGSSDEARTADATEEETPRTTDDTETGSGDGAESNPHRRSGVAE